MTFRHDLGRFVVRITGVQMAKPKILPVPEDDRSPVEEILDAHRDESIDTERAMLLLLGEIATALWVNGSTLDEIRDRLPELQGKERVH